MYLSRSTFYVIINRFAEKFVFRPSQFNNDEQLQQNGPLGRACTIKFLCSQNSSVCKSRNNFEHAMIRSELIIIIIAIALATIIITGSS